MDGSDDADADGALSDDADDGFVSTTLSATTGAAASGVGDGAAGASVWAAGNCVVVETGLPF